MAAIGANAYAQLTLVEVAKRHDPSGQMAAIAEVVNEENEILQDAVWVEANDTFANKTVRRSNLPNGTWRKLNAGVVNEVSMTTEVWDTIGILETFSQNDVEVIKAFNNPAQARMDEARAFIEGLGQTMAEAMIYSNSSTTPEKFTGIAPRLSNIAATENCINEGGTTGTSIYVVDWGPGKVQMMYPKNSTAGLMHEDLGKQLIQDGSANNLMAYVDHFQWKAGMAVKNMKSIGRIANIEPTGSANIFDEDNLITLLNRMTQGPGRRIYVDQVVKTQMEIAQKDKANAYYTLADNPLAPGPVLMFKGVPVRQVDQIITSETTLT